MAVVLGRDNERNLIVAAPKLLLVEDDPALAELLEYRFQAEGEGDECGWGKLTKLGLLRTDLDTCIH